MKIGIIIQARMCSTRLPGKVLLKLNNKTILERMINKVKSIKGIDKVIIATTLNSSDDVIYDFCIKNNIICFRGSENDVLKRFLDATEKYNLDVIIRLTADCPLFSSKILKTSLKYYINSRKKYDYFFVEGYPRGLGDIEFISYNALVICNVLATEKSDREHVMTYIIKNPQYFNIKIINVKNINKKLYRPELRLCIDTIEDFKVVLKIIKYFKSDDIDIKKIINYLDNNPNINKINKNIIQRIT